MLIINKKYEDSDVVMAARLTGEVVHIEANDYAVMQRLNDEASRQEQSDTNATLLFADGVSLWQLQTLGIPDEVSQRMDIIATTMEDLTAKTLLLRLPGIQADYPSLDRIPQGYNSEKTVHLVIFGNTAMAEALATNTALVAHYPNYCRDTRLRTRITVIDPDVFSLRDRMTMLYHRLFEHSYYRSLNLDDNEPQCMVHCPEYEGQRKDFVDVEWEFVKANAGNDAVRKKLSFWANAENQQLTIAVCGNHSSENTVMACTLPDEIQENGIPVLFHTSQDSCFNIPTSGNLFPFSEKICRTDILNMLQRMAKGVNFIYNHCFSLPPDAPVTSPAKIDTAVAEQQWRELPLFSKRYSNILNAMTLGTKMHSVGLTVDDWQAYYALSRFEIEVLAEVEHNRWSVEELMLGFRPVTDEEQRAVEQDISLKRTLRNRKIHYDLRAFDDLRSDDTGKNVSIYDQALTQGIPLILKQCITD